MQISALFSKDLYRPINGVIKVNEQAADAVWQELDEYIVTKELRKHFTQFFAAYRAAQDNPHDALLRDRIGVWVSGFFGSGKSHFIKILSYLLQNKSVVAPQTGQLVPAASFFDHKITDAALLASIRRAVSSKTDVLLFNIEGKADRSDGSDAILRVFLRVFNELQGFSADFPHLAEMELQLRKEGRLDAFHEAFYDEAGSTWQEERDAYQFRRDEIINALVRARGKSHDEAARWFDRAEEDYSLNVEKFARRVREYLDYRGPEQRIVFVADEVGQFIGSDTHLMLNLQTITENLGTVCGGRAWVAVTSQEDIDAVLGQVTAARANDFSKITARFNTRLSLSSSNTDEVIQARLLEKTPAAKGALTALYQQKGDILQHQLSFTNNSATLRNYRDATDFVQNYPFAPYHYQLVQSVFESIRKAGATGTHLSRGERSLLDAFQFAARSIGADAVGRLVPFYAFYPPVESFLDTAVKRTIDLAGENPSLEPFDSEILRLLFLIRYVELVKPHLDNLVTLCVPEVDADRLALKKKIGDSVQRLERETLINRNGDLYYFLTNEERDISREIKAVEVSAHEMTRRLAEIIFEEVAKDAARHRYAGNKNDFGFNRTCDGLPYGNRVEGHLPLEIITPLFDEYGLYHNARCTLASGEDGGRILLRLPESRELGAELRLWLQTERYLQHKNNASLPAATTRILRDRADENRERRQRLVSLLQQLFSTADYFAAGQALVSAPTGGVKLNYAQNYLIVNTFNKLDYLSALQANPSTEIRRVLEASPARQNALDVPLETVNAHALDEVRGYINLRLSASMPVTLQDLADYFSRRPFGWPQWEIVLLAARLFAGGELKVKIDGATVEPRTAADAFTKTPRWRAVLLLPRKTTGQAALKTARSLAQELFSKLGPENEDGLADFIRQELGAWQENLGHYETFAATGRYPGAKLLQECRQTLRKQLAVRDTFEFFAAFNTGGEDWRDLAEDYHQLHDFYTRQRFVWERLQQALAGPYLDNLSLLQSDAEARQVWQRLTSIAQSPAPYNLLHETDGLLARLETANKRLLEARREAATREIEQKIAAVKRELQSVKADAHAHNRALYPLQQIKRRIAEEKSVARLAYAQNDEATEEVDRVLQVVEALKPRPADAPAVKPRPVRVVKPAATSTKLYLDTAQDVEEYLQRLRQELLDVLRDNGRIRLQ